MDDAGAVRALERLGDLDAVAEHLLERQRAFGQAIRQRLALEKLHHQIVDAVVRADVVGRADVRMGERRDRLRLALEPLAQTGIGREPRRQDLDGHGTVEPRVARAIDFAHAARAELRGHFVGTETGAGGDQSVPRGYRVRAGLILTGPAVMVLRLIRRYVYRFTGSTV